MAHPNIGVYTKCEAGDIYQALTGMVDWESVVEDLFFFSCLCSAGLLIFPNGVCFLSAASAAHLTHVLFERG